MIVTYTEPAQTARAQRLGKMDRVLTRALYAVTVLFLLLNTTALLGYAHDNHSTLQRIRDCTEPGHSCYDRGAVRTGKLIDDLVQRIEVSDFCAARLGNDTVAKIHTCVAHVLGK
jgi:hypothetical protein